MLTAFLAVFGVTTCLSLGIFVLIVGDENPPRTIGRARTVPVTLGFGQRKLGRLVPKARKGNRRGGSRPLSDRNWHPV